jgi:hypothetical protein
MKEKRNSELPIEKEITRTEPEAAQGQIVEKLYFSLVTYSDLAIETIRTIRFKI